MTDIIGKKLVEATKGIIPVSLYEAEASDYPYAVYDSSPEYFRTKDGVYKIVSSLLVTVYAKTFAEAKDLSDRVDSAVLTQMNNGTFRSFTVTRADRCVEGIWQSEVRFQITQNN